MNNRKKVLYYLVDVQTGVQLKCGVKYKDITVFVDPFNVDYRFVYKGRCIWNLFRVTYFYCRKICIKDRECIILYSYPFVFFKCKDLIYHVGVLLGLSGGSVDKKKDVLNSLVKFLDNEYYR